MTRMRTATEVTDLAARRGPAPGNPALAGVMLERQRIADGVHDVVIQRFHMVPHAVIAALTADAVDWLKQAGDVVTVSAVRPLVVESLELRLRLCRRL